MLCRCVEAIEWNASQQHRAGIGFKQRKNVGVLALHNGRGGRIGVRTFGDEREILYAPSLRITIESGNLCQVCSASFKAQCSRRCFWCVADAEQGHPQVILVEESVERPVPGVLVLCLKEVKRLPIVPTPN